MTLATEVMDRVRFPASCGRGEPTEHQATHRQLDHRLARLHLALIVPGSLAVASQPSEASFNDPPPRLDTETARARCPFHDLEVPAVALLLAPLRQLLAPVGRIGPDLLEQWNEERETAQELADADGVMDVSGGDDVGGDAQAQRIDQQMAFPTLHALSGHGTRGCTPTPRPSSHSGSP